MNSFDSQRSQAAAFLCLSSPRRPLTEIGIMNVELSGTLNTGGIKKSDVMSIHIFPAFWKCLSDLPGAKPGGSIILI